jgi:FkbM family methyltransferase
MSLRCYDRYLHSVGFVYRQLGVEVEDTFLPHHNLAGLGASDLLAALVPSIRTRLNRLAVPQGDQIIEKPGHRVMHFRSRPVIIPLLNQQAIEWYGSSSIFNYDFIVEDSLGLLDEAKVIYDLGGHQGIWAMFYSVVAGKTGRVYTFEPSTVNVEASALAFLVNDIDSIINIGAGLKTAPAPGVLRGIPGFSEANPAAGMLIDFKGEIPLVDISTIMWDRADFLKMDIEGYEYDLVTANPWIFDVAKHLHIEVHVPHLERRNLDYRDITRMIDFDRFEVFNCQNLQVVPIVRDAELSGFCSLMLRRRD